MKLSFMLSKDCVLTGMRGGDRTKQDLFTELVGVLSANSTLSDEHFSREEIVEGLLQREEELSTGVGSGFAFPHVRIHGLKGAYMLFATCPEGVEYNAPDRKPVNFIFLTILSEENANLLLQSRAALMRMLLSKEAQDTVLQQKDPLLLWKYIDRNGSSISKDIEARDIMCPQNGFLRSSMTVYDAATVLHKYHSDLLPVLDDEGRMTGVVSCHDIFRKTIPELFFQMRTVSFMKHLDPFAQGLDNDAVPRVADLLTKKRTECHVVPPDATLIEVLFMFCAKDARMVYVVDQGVLLGVIHRYAVVDKIITGDGTK